MIDHIYCINLDHRTDRWRQASEQFKKHNLNVQRVSAVDGRSGSFGNDKCDNYNNACTLSHLKVITDAWRQGYKTIMVFEDDADLNDEFMSKLGRSVIDLIGINWDLLYLGGSHRKPPIKITDNLYQVVHTLTTHAYIMRHTMFRDLMYDFPSLHQPVDCYFAELQPKYNCFITNPPLAGQRKSYSDLAHREMEYPWLKTNDQ